MILTTTRFPASRWWKSWMSKTPSKRGIVSTIVKVLATAVLILGIVASAIGTVSVTYGWQAWDSMSSILSIKDAYPTFPASTVALILTALAMLIANIHAFQIFRNRHFSRRQCSGLAVAVCRLILCAAAIGLWVETVQLYNRATWQWIISTYDSVNTNNNTATFMGVAVPEDAPIQYRLGLYHATHVVPISIAVLVLVFLEEGLLLSLPAIQDQVYTAASSAEHLEFKTIALNDMTNHDEGISSNRVSEIPSTEIATSRPSSNGTSLPAYEEIELERKWAPAATKS